MKFDYFVTPTRSDAAEPFEQVYADGVEQVRPCDEMGIDTIWFPGHQFTNQPCSPAPLLNVEDDRIVARHPAADGLEIGNVDPEMRGRGSVVTVQHMHQAVAGELGDEVGPRRPAPPVTSTVSNFISASHDGANRSWANRRSAEVPEAEASNA